MVPLPTEDEDVLNFKPDKGLWLLGFLEAAKVPRHHFMKVRPALLVAPVNTTLQGLAAVIGPRSRSRFCKATYVV